jgi:hypothetical protein
MTPPSSVADTTVHIPGLSFVEDSDEPGFAGVRHDASGNWLLEMLPTVDGRWMDVVAPHLDGTDWTRPGDEVSADPVALAAYRAARGATQRLIEPWWVARDEAAQQACIERGLCPGCAEISEAVDHDQYCAGAPWPLDAAAIEHKLGIDPPPIPWPESRAISA